MQQRGHQTLAPRAFVVILVLWTVVGCGRIGFEALSDPDLTLGVDAAGGDSLDGGAAGGSSVDATVGGAGGGSTAGVDGAAGGAEGVVVDGGLPDAANGDAGMEPTCSDAIQNGSETEVDCGGTCVACPTCTDGIQNGDEVGTDCGGSTCSVCLTCTDGIKNGDETDVDCGSSICPPCGDGLACSLPTDCTSADCTGGVCQPSGPLGPFDPPTPIAALSHSAFDDDPSFTEDRLELYFASNRPGGPGLADIWVTTRASTADPWGAPVLVAELASSDDESAPGVSPDGLTLWFQSDRTGCVGRIDIWVTTRASRTETWSTPTCVPELNTPQNDQGPAPTSTLLEMVLASNRPGGTDVNLFLATRLSITDPWGTPTAIANVNSSQREFKGVLVRSGLELYFGSTRTGSAGLDLYVATRASKTELFSTPVPVSELNTAQGDADPWLSADGTYVVFASSRTGNWELYEATR